MSVSRQIREAQQAAASNPDAPASRRPAIARAAPPPPAPKTQAQLDSWVRSAGKEKGEVDEEEPGSEIEQRKKKGRGASRSEYDSDADEQLGQGGSDDDEGNEGDEGIAAEENEDEGHGDPDDDEPMLAPKAATKGRKTRRLVKSRKKRSVGHFLVENAGGVVKCVLCLYSPENLRPDNILRHWKKEHAEPFKAVTVANDSGRDVGAVVRSLHDSVSTPTGAIQKYVVKKQRVVEQTPKIMKEVALLRWVISNRVAFNALDSDCFNDMLTEWGVTLESKSTVLNLLTPLFEHVVLQTTEILAACAGIACTFDLWTSSAGRKYLAVTYHGIDKSWNLFHCVLDVVHFHGSTQSEVIAAVVKQCIDKHLPKNKLVTVVVSDGAADTRRAREDLLEFDGHDCFNHDLNLSLGDALKVAKGAAKDFATMEHLIREIESDKNLRIFFENMQKITGFEVAQKFVHRNDTRWTGLADSVAKFLKMREVFFVEDQDGLAEKTRQLILEDWPAELSQDVFQNKYWKRLKAYNGLLVPLSVASRSAQSLSVPTGSRVPKLMYDMKSAWQKSIENAADAVKEFGQALLDCLSRRCNKYVEVAGNTMKAAVLDPSQSRFLVQFGVSAEVIAESWEGVVKEAQDEFDLEQKLVMEEEEELFSDGAIVKGQVDALKTLLLRTKIPFDDADPLKFYRQNSLNCLTYAPLACRVAANLLGIPAGESHSERVFSWAGGFVTKLRNRLSDETLQELVVMYDFFRSNRMPWDEFKMSFANALATAVPK